MKLLETMNRVLLCLSFALFVTVSYADEPCDSRGRSCVAGKATCEDGSCVCTPPATWGDGTFDCYEDDVYVAQIWNDPDEFSFDESLLLGFNNESIPFPFPCRYLATHFVTELNDGENRLGECEFKIHAFNFKHYGKWFFHGFDVALRINFTDDTVKEMSTRHYGKAENGRLRWKIKSFDDRFYPDGPWINVPIFLYENENKTVNVRLFRDPLSSQFNYVADQCGFRMTFVPYDVFDPEQVFISGLSIVVKKDHMQDEKWLSNDEVMVLPPGVTYASKLDTEMTREQALFYKAFQTPIVQNMRMQDEGTCELIHQSFQQSTIVQARSAMNNCYWIARNPEFIACYDPTERSVLNILPLFNECVKVYNGQAACEDVIQMISTSGCDTQVEGIPELPLFLAGDLCPTV